MNAAALPAVIFGLGNPGPKHAADRHNAGFWFVDRLAAAGGGSFREEPKLAGSACQAGFAGRTLRLVKPATFMNRSGQCVRRVMDYYQVPLAGMLVVHDDVDLPPGTARLKAGGGHGGNNGLRDIIAHCGADFLRLRLGVGHPGQKDQVADYVLHAAPAAERALIDQAMEESLRALETWFTQDFQRAVTRLHTATPPAGAARSPPP
ncbi:MAG: aminoacyl-tRNA hydrolase [Gammaproteobacteria bacterium]|nr:aminoacyl-tRNA hydrolase [Gammaproteobacteria bacterium]